MASVAVLLVMLVCAAYQYFKGTIVKAVVTIIIVIIASLIAFGFFEFLANFFISRGSDSRYPALVPWVQSLSFILLFILAFAIMQTAAVQFTKHPVDFGLLPERIGRIVGGIILGLLISGVLLTAAAMAPLPSEYPYQRFDETNPNAESPKQVLFNADGFAAGLFSVTSGGSFRAIQNPRSFAALHPDYLDELFLNRHNPGEDIPLVTSARSIEISRENSCWYARQDIKDANDNPVATKDAHTLVIVRVGISKNAYKDAGKFTLSQLRLICKKKGFGKHALRGGARSVYPVGYLTTGGRLQKRKLNHQIRMASSDFGQQARTREIDFAFYVANDLTPVLAGFKLNNLAEVPEPVSSDKAPSPVPFVEQPPSKGESKPANAPGGRGQRANRPSNDTSGTRGRGPSNFSRQFTGDGFDE
jgi:hypothetical protein